MPIFPLVALLLMAVAIQAPPAAGQPASGGAEIALPLPEQAVVTRHTLGLDDETLAYTAAAGALTLEDRRERPQGQVFYVAYTLDGAAAEDRPVTFVFNGGPGAASAFLHLGAIGPRRLATAADGTLPSARAPLADNGETWLPFTDLVFLDPVGTGFSRGIGEEDDADGQFWGIRQDLRALAEAIRLYVATTGRWGSPKFLVGESYGGFRAAALAEMLPDDFGIGLDGVVLISPSLDFGTIATRRYEPMAWAFLLPSYAAAAQAHGLGGNPEGDRDALLAEAERYALTDYLTTLVAGGEPAPGFYADLAARIGLLEEEVARRHGRVSKEAFAKLLLRPAVRRVGLYDGSLSAIDPAPSSERYGREFQLAGLKAPLTEAFSAYVRDELGFTTDLRFRLLNDDANGGWDWSDGGGGRGGYPGAADELAAAMNADPALQVLVVHGIYDLVTPYLASKYLIGQMPLDPAARANLRFVLTEGGHMMYLREDARRQLAREARALYGRALAAVAASPGSG